MVLRKYYFSLLEFILALTILLLVSGVISMRVHYLIEEHRFKNNEKKIKYFLRYSYCMALSQQTDVVMTLLQKKKGLQCEIAVEGDMGFFEDSAKETFYLKDFYLQGISNIKNRCFFNFTSSGVVYPKGEYIFCNKKKNYEFCFDPQILFNTEEKEEKIKKLYPFK